MSLARFERFFDRIAPALILVLGASITVAFAGIVGF